MAVDTYTKLLLHCDGADTSQTFIDSATGKAVTAVGTAQVDTAQSKFGGSSLLLDGNSDYLTIPDSADWDFGSGNFTIDCWIRCPSVDLEAAIFDVAGSYSFAILRRTHHICLYASSNGSSWDLLSNPNGEGTAILAVDTWYHIAAVRNGNNYLTFINGVKDLDVTVSGTIATKNALRKIGNRGAIDLWFNGWIDEFRVSKGIARWTANFTPPTSAYGVSVGGLGIGNPYIF